MAKTFDEVVYSLCRQYTDQSQLGFKSVKQLANGFEIEYVNGTKATYTVQNMHKHDNMAILNVLNKDADGDLTFNGKKITNLTADQEQLLMKFSLSANNKLLFDGKPIEGGSSGGAGEPYDDTVLKGLIDTNKTNIATNASDIVDLTTKIGTTAMGTTATDVTGAVAEVNGNQLDTVSFSADYKNIVLNRKNGTNPYTIPISAIINHAKLIELADIDTADIGNGKTLVYDAATQKHKYVSSSGTDELVKMDSTSDAHYLADLIDKQTIVNDNGILKVKKLDGQEVTIAEINYLKGLTMNVMELVNMFSNGGVKIINTPVATYADLLAYDKTSFIDGISYLVYVLADETHDNAKTTYLIDKDTAIPTYFGFAGEHRDFITSPIDLANEVTGKLGTSHIDVDSLWELLTVDDTYKTLTATDNVFGTHGAKNMYDELTTAIGAKANATDLTTHTDDTDIHITSVEREAWNNKANDNEVIKKADIKTTLDENSTNDDIYGGKAIFDAIKKNCVGKETVLYEGDINAAGTYTLTDDVNNYDFIIINYYVSGMLYCQSLTMNKIAISTCIDYDHRFMCNYGYSSTEDYTAGHFNNNKLIIDAYVNMNINSIVGYKFGQVTVQNTITNPSPAASYSTDEQLTGGTWIDGKPIYRRVFIGSWSATVSVWTATNISVVGFETLISASCKRSAREADNPFVQVEMSDTLLNIAASAGTHTINQIILEYTKTTD